jgi:hypothetical protein
MGGKPRARKLYEWAVRVGHVKSLGELTLYACGYEPDPSPATELLMESLGAGWVYRGANAVATCGQCGGFSLMSAGYGHGHVVFDDMPEEEP